MVFKDFVNYMNCDEKEISYIHENIVSLTDKNNGDVEMTIDGVLNFIDQQNSMHKDKVYIASLLCFVQDDRPINQWVIQKINK